MAKSPVFLPAILSGVLLWTAYFPLNLGPVAFFAMVPFLTLVHAEGIGGKRRYLAAFLGGVTFYGIALNWIRVAHPMMALFAWPGLTLYCALYWPLTIYLLRKLDRWNLPLAATYPVVAVSLEYCRCHFPTGFGFMVPLHMHQLIGFGWYFLGYTQHAVLPLIQVVDLGGVYLISAMVAAINGAVYEWVVRYSGFRRILGRPVVWRQAEFYREFWVTGLALLPLGLGVIYGTFRLTHPPFERGPVVAAIQGNLGQDEKMVRGDQVQPTQQTPLEAEYFPLAIRARGEETTRPPDLIIWPETCFPSDWWQVGPNETNAPDYFTHNADVAPKNFAFRMARQWKATTLFGLNSLVWEGGEGRKYNSALLIHADGSFGGRYDKVHLVPFGEYVPLKNFFPWLQKFTPYSHDYSCTPGSEWTRFQFTAASGKPYKFGVLICYEDSDPYPARRYNTWSGGEGVDFLVNISNDGWFDGTEEHEQHLAICRFRAVEARRAVVRSVNMGISAMIDPDGRVLETTQPGPWANSKKVRGIIRGEVPIDRRGTVYAALGDWFPLLCWALLAGGLFAPRRTPRSSNPEAVMNDTSRA